MKSKNGVPTHLHGSWFVTVSIAAAAAEHFVVRLVAVSGVDGALSEWQPCARGRGDADADA